MPHKPSFAKLGFTLIELLVVVTIIILLVTIAVPTYNKFVARGRDTKRQANLNIVRSALEQYKSDQNFYPTSLDLSQPLTSNSGNPTASATPKVYLGRIAPDPLASNGLFSLPWYDAKPTSCNNTTVTCTSYCLYASVEDSTLGNSASVSCPDKTSDPGKTAYNYELTPP
jgi:general secretion pathway protein G